MTWIPQLLWKLMIYCNCGDYEVVVPAKSIIFLFKILLEDPIINYGVYVIKQLITCSWRVSSKSLRNVLYKGCTSDIVSFQEKTSEKKACYAFSFSCYIKQSRVDLEAKNGLRKTSESDNDWFRKPRRYHKTRAGAKTKLIKIYSE